MPKKYNKDNFNPLENTEAIASFESKTLMTSWHYLDVLAQEHAVAFTVAKMMNEDMLADVRLAMQKAIKEGMSFDEFQKQLKPMLMKKGWWGEKVEIDPKTGKAKKVQLGSTRRLRTIYHTNKQTAYASGQWQRIQRTKKYLPYLQYKPSVSKNKRDGHKDYYGLILPVEHQAWQYLFPPNGYGCKCWVKQLTKKQAEREKQKQAKNGESKEDFELEFEDFKNPRTGKIIQVPKGIAPSFAHNHDRLTAVSRLALDRHGSNFVKKIEKDYLENGKYNKAINNWLTPDERKYYYSEIMHQFSDLIEKFDLTNYEFMAIRHYTGEGYKYLKELFTGHYKDIKKLTNETLFSLIFIRELLNKALAKMPKWDTVEMRELFDLKNKGKLIRWTDLTEYELSTFKKGEVVTFNHFASTSYGGDVIIDDRNNTRFIIHSKNGRLIESLSFTPKETEVLFMSPTKFRVLDREDKDDYTEITLKEII